MDPIRTILPSRSPQSPRSGRGSPVSTGQVGSGFDAAKCTPRLIAWPNREAGAIKANSELMQRVKGLGPGAGRRLEYHPRFSLTFLSFWGYGASLKIGKKKGPRRERKAPHREAAAWIRRDKVVCVVQTVTLFMPERKEVANEARQAVQ